MRANRRATSVVGTSLRWALPLLLVLLVGGTTSRAEDAPDTTKLTPVPAPPKPYKAEFPADLPFDPAAGWTTGKPYKPFGDTRAKRVRGREYPVWWASFPATLRTDGPNSNAAEVADLYSMMFESLIQVDPETLEFIPCLASHWKVETHPDKTQTFTFRIDDRAKWADGQPVQADDVFWTYCHRANPDRNDPSQSMTFGEGYELPKILDRRTIQVKTRTVNWRLLLYFGGMIVYPAREMAIPGGEYIDDWNWKFMTGSGPYRMLPEDLKKGDSLTLTRRNDWWAENEPWGKHTYNFDRVRHVVIRDVEVAYETFKKGDLGAFVVSQARRWVDDIPKEKLVAKGWVQRRKIFNRRPVGFAGLCFNMRKPPFDDRRVRLAFAHLFHREKLMGKLFFNEYEYTNSIHPSSDWGTGDERPRIEYDPTLAQELLAEAGYVKRDSDGFLLGPDGKRLEVTLEYDSQEWERIWLPVQEDYKKAGVKFELKLLDPSTLFKKVQERQFTIHFQSWRSIIFPNPETSWRSSLADQNYNNNTPGFRNARVDELCKTYNGTFERDEQRKIIREVDEIVCDEHPYAFAWHARFSRILYWDRFGHPDTYMSKIEQDPQNSILLSWWFDEEKEKALEKAMKEGTDLPQGPLEVKPWG